ncbi:hypothetical protein [Aliirhizobium cellulosilyticum]|uniref:Uncharacterized protein n=1 Tax=Aliirhizobium cellulosilyticum TaxID=393664 RepID=A0A7W6THC0_9HYPH|nr:hypothetical protein [Rhizobium cellulosilyticum]MBB4349423.1 hypothetical protein [Rhizobium cellulosilyticum]MBB4412355.1 hypothetical protein [Rhizobium cellulosilyticum]MBB4446986.1 hypothetical protein [Rhizobium cellulosilyticum]
MVLLKTITVDLTMGAMGGPGQIGLEVAGLVVIIITETPRSILMHQCTIQPAILVAIDHILRDGTITITPSTILTPTWGTAVAIQNGATIGWETHIGNWCAITETERIEHKSSAKQSRYFYVLNRI